MDQRRIITNLKKENGVQEKKLKISEQRFESLLGDFEQIKYQITQIRINKMRGQMNWEQEIDTLNRNVQEMMRQQQQ